MCKPMICLVRTQDLQGKDDCFCVACWEEDIDHSGETPYYYLSSSYSDREECVGENCVSEAEFELMVVREHGEEYKRTGKISTLRRDHRLEAIMRRMTRR